VIEPRGTTELAVEISDDGVGFIIDRVPPGSFGLEGIRQRARLFGREAVIETGSGRGVRIRVVLPMRAEMR
jgi:signal transduction histidine kinase